MKDFKQWWRKSEIIAGEGSMDAAEEAWNARVPEGYVVVPREPTKKMIIASMYYNDCFSDDPIQLNIDVYKAMIASAERE